MSNTMAYCTDSFTFRKRALFICDAPLDFSYETSCSGFDINGTEPEGTNRRVIFKINGKLYRFENAGLQEYKNRGELEDVLTDGNTVAELLSLRAIPEFVGKKVFPVIALDAPADAPVFPRIKIAAKVNSFNDVYTRYFYSPVYNLPPKSRLFQVVESKYTNGNASILTQCSINGGEWTFLPEAAFKDAATVQFRAQVILSALDGSDFADLHSVKAFYSTDKEVLAAPDREIISLPQDFTADLKSCYALIQHAPLVDAHINAFVSFTKAPVHRENVFIGTATGESQTLSLAFNGVVDSCIAADSIHLDIDGRTFAGFFFDVERSTVTLTAEAGKAIVASYDCYDFEDWREMEYLDGDNFHTRFNFYLADSLDKRVVNVKFVITRLSGTVENKQLGLGTGKVQVYALEHRAKAESLACTGAFTYDEGAQILKVVAPPNVPVVVSYDWQAALPAVDAYCWGAAII